LAKSLNFTLSFFGEEPEYKSPFHIELDTGGFELEAAPITPSDSSSFRLIAGTNKAVFGDDTVNAPTGMFGEWKSSEHPRLMCSQHRYEAFLEPHIQLVPIHSSCGGGEPQPTHCGRGEWSAQERG
jgi:hypothetical protein